MSGMVFALGLVVLGDGDGAGLGEGAAVALCVDAVWPPHPATAAQVAKVMTTRLGRNRFFNFSIGGTLSEQQDLTGDVLYSL